MDLLVWGIGQLATPLGSRARAGKEQGQVQVLKEAYVHVQGGYVAEVGRGKPSRINCPVLDVEGRAVTPGLVDPHTHAVFAGHRVQEFWARGRGEKYTGGGILTTVRATREASLQDLVGGAKARLLRMLGQGTTTMEIKSGYGLSLEEELKILRAVRALQGEVPMGLVPTLMAAHAFPPELSREAYVRTIVEDIVPAAAGEGLARFCDVFCDQGFFSVEEARAVLQAARAHGLGLKVHADELAPVGAAELAGELSAISAEHLLHVSPAGIEALARAQTVAVLLPATALVSSLPYPPARDLIGAGVPVALGTDFNPGSSPVASMPLVMSLAALKLRMSPEEVLCAATLNAAAALGLAHEIGSVEVGKKADLVVWDASSFEEIPYWIGQNLAWAVLTGGRVVGPPPSPGPDPCAS